MPVKMALLLLVIASIWTLNADAETHYPLITYKCDTEADIVLVTNSLLKTNEGKSYSYSAENGTYSPWNMVEIDRNPEKTKIIRTIKVTNTCTLSSGKYTILLEPQIFSKDLSGRCGESISAALTVQYDGFDLLERTAFDDYCKGNAPVITRVTVFGKTRKVKIKKIPRYRFY